MYVYSFLALMISPNSGLREAPPTKNPSTSCWRAGKIRINVDEIRLNSRAFTKLLAVGSGDTTAVQDLDVVGYDWRDSFGQVSPYVGVSLLRLSTGGDFASTDGPYRLVRDNDLTANTSSEWIYHRAS
jgi:hypothetical protein